jgi:hypothetical protein
MTPATHEFFQILPDDARFPDQWFLDDPRTDDGEEIDSREFTLGKPYRGPRPKTVPIGKPGRAIAFTFGAFDMPVVSNLVVDAIARLALPEAEFFPVMIEGARAEYQIANAVVRADCLDEARSEYTLWDADDLLPEHAGQYRMVSTIRIDPTRARGHHIFRLSRWPVALLVSDALRQELQSVPNLGVVFDPVV